ncbi:MAG: hypothetical protein DHS20C15_28430 [Planctomycetota bacterium]|nr:MAG: hypothetical protein DHS20C15_28430 [Planctomycetota bacterium]
MSITLRSAALACLLSLAACSSGGVHSSVADAPDARPTLSDYNLDSDGLAIKGYDPVSYFPDFGGEARKGSAEFSATHRGVTYRFVSESHKQTFLENPAAFEPRYGGWCAWAMADGKGDKVRINPKSFTIEDGKLYLFYDSFLADTREMWLDAGGADELAPPSDENWERLSGEEPDGDEDDDG